MRLLYSRLIRRRWVRFFFTDIRSFDNFLLYRCSRRRGEFLYRLASFYTVRRDQESMMIMLISRLEGRTNSALVYKRNFAFNLSAVAPTACRLTITKASLMFRSEIHSSFYDEAVFACFSFLPKYWVDERHLWSLRACSLFRVLSQKKCSVRSVIWRKLLRDPRFCDCFRQTVIPVSLVHYSASFFATLYRALH